MKSKFVNMNIDTGEKTWLTPPSIIKALGPFDLDPCCPPKMPWKTAAEMVCRPADGLAVDWSGKRVWLNPPYGREAVPFLKKMASHTGGGYCTSLFPHRHGGVAYMDFPIRILNHVSSRTTPIPWLGRFSKRYRSGSVGSRCIFGKRLCRTIQLPPRWKDTKC